METSDTKSVVSIDQIFLEGYVGVPSLQIKKNKKYSMSDSNS